MRKELKRPEVFLGVLVTLALVFPAVMGVPALAQPSFSGDVETDFPDTDPGVLIFTDSGGKDVLVPNHPVTNTSSGWDIKDVRLTYNSTTDILYVGLNSYETVGDADTDDNEGGMQYDSGTDAPNLGMGESVAVYFDLDQDDNWDVIAGVPDDTDFSGFTVKTAIGTVPYTALFDADLATGYDHVDPTPYWTPASAPDFEFRILNFSHLPDHGGALGAFTIGAFMGSWADVSIIEDTLVGSTGPHISIVKKTNGTDNNSGPGPYIAVNGTVNWTYEVANTGSVNLTNIVVTDDNGTPGILGDDFHPSPVDVSPSDGFNDGDTDKDNELDLTETWLYQASDSATVGQHSNVANATGYSYGLPVSDSDPDYYTGVDVRISIFPLEGDNEVGTNHVLTILLEKSVATGVWTPLAGETVTASLSNSGGATAAFVGSNSGTTSASGEFSVTINSTTPGSTTIWADWTGGTVEGATITARTTDPDADKDWVDVRISISPLEADNEVDTNHVLTILLESSVGSGVWTPLAAETVTASLSNSGGATATFVGSSSGSTNLTGQFDVTITSPTTGSTTVWAEWGGGTVEGTTITARTTDPDADKDWVTASIHIEKSTNGEDADEPSEGPEIPAGDAVLWEYVITNYGSKNLTNIVVTDDNGTPSDTSDDFHPSPVDVSPFDGFNDGDTDMDNELDLTEAWIYQASDNAAVGQYANIGYVTGEPTGGGPTVSDDDPSHYDGLGPDIDIEKYTNNDNADEAPGPYISVNGTVTWKYIVINTGAVNLTGIVVTDDRLGVITGPAAGDDGNDGVLEPYSQTGETWIYQATGVAEVGQYANNGTVVGHYDAVEVTDSDPSHYFGKTAPPPPAVGWETYPVNKVRVLLPWIVLLAAIIVGASLLVLRHRQTQS